MLIGGSNAVNLTDGLDGLLSGTAAIAFGAFSIIAVAQEQFGVAIFCMA
ncbi:MAG TPA: phospho-N-acetylmuramoyl-pentapeptide-transferase, partial [Bacillus sp. (in: Bacteria)]|nr:phospho-N-acetylmuramoyl-pentapeptide-transferase [Bacillus sp. (in: firmicutes)]